MTTLRGRSAAASARGHDPESPDGESDPPPSSPLTGGGGGVAPSGCGDVALSLEEDPQASGNAAAAAHAVTKKSQRMAFHVARLDR
jgi:hypothetical protein